MTAQEFYIVYDARRPRDPEKDFAGRLTERDCAQLYEVLNG